MYLNPRSLPTISWRLDADESTTRCRGDEFIYTIASVVIVQQYMTPYCKWKNMPLIENLTHQIFEVWDDFTYLHVWSSPRSLLCSWLLALVSTLLYTQFFMCPALSLLVNCELALCVIPCVVLRATTYSPNGIRHFLQRDDISARGRRKTISSLRTYLFPPPPSWKKMLISWESPQISHVMIWFDSAQHSPTYKHDTKPEMPVTPIPDSSCRYIAVLV